MYWETTLDIKKSKFIARLAPCRSLQEARSFLKHVSEPRASHNCWAAIDPSGQGLCNDDGEPSGTAGRPMKTMLESQNIAGAVVVVTRYFGGTKLGTGGLVKAYSDSVSEVVNLVDWEPIVERVLLRVEGIPPSKTGKLYQLASDDHFATSILDEEEEEEEEDDDMMDFSAGTRSSILLRVEVSKVSEVEGTLRRLDPSKVEIFNEGVEPHEVQFHGLELLDE